MGGHLPPAEPPPVWRRPAERSPVAEKVSRQGGDRYIWPVNGWISSPFGPRAGGMHTGIDLAADHGTDIRAARAGVVKNAGWLGGYGLTVIIAHADEALTLYAHAAAVVVAEGERVEQGQVIARVGSTGTATGPHLHFEVLIDGEPADPLLYLPP